MKRIIAGLVLSASLFGGEIVTPKPEKPHKLLYASAGALIAATAADIITTEQGLKRPGVYEANPMGLRTAMIMKISSTSGLLFTEYLLRNHPRLERMFAAVNVVVSVELGVAAIHNRGVK